MQSSQQTGVYTLEILAETPEIAEFYKTRASLPGDAGVDLYTPCRHTVDITTGSAHMIGMGIRCRMLDPDGNPVSYYLYPRSSLANTPLMLANSVGIIDAGYRGEIKAAFRNFFGVHVVSPGTRLVQLCAPGLQPIKVKLVTELNTTERGSGGFGSTGN